MLAALYSPQEQAIFVAQRMRELHEEEGIPYDEMAVLYRAHFQSMDVQLQLTQDGVPFTVTSGGLAGTAGTSAAFSVGAG